VAAIYAVIFHYISVSNMSNPINTFIAHGYRIPGWGLRKDGAGRLMWQAIPRLARPGYFALNLPDAEVAAAEN
jgi:hypothetical protein